MAFARCRPLARVCSRRYAADVEPQAHPGHAWGGALAARPNGSKMRSCIPGIKPMPSSRTVNVAP